MPKYLIHGSDGSCRHQRICCRQRLSESLIEDERVSRRPHDDTSREPALEELGSSHLSLRRGNERCRFGRLVQITLYVAYHAHHFTENATDIKILSERALKRKIFASARFIDDNDGMGGLGIGRTEFAALLQCRSKGPEITRSYFPVIHGDPFRFLGPHHPHAN